MGLETKNTENEIQLLDDDPIIIDEEKQPLKIDENQPGINEKDQKVDENQPGINEKVQQVVEIVDIEIDTAVDENQLEINKKDQKVDENQPGITEKDQQIQIVDSPMVELIEDDVDLVENNGKNNEISKDNGDNGTINNGKNNENELIEIVRELDNRPC